MIESGSQPTWVSVAEAARAIGITETAIRKRVRAGALPARGERGATEVLISVANLSDQSTEPAWRGFRLDAVSELARLTGELTELRARLSEAQHDRDRWHGAAIEAREDARAALVARDAIERELRMLLARS